MKMRTSNHPTVARVVAEPKPEPAGRHRSPIEEPEAACTIADRFRGLSFIPRDLWKRPPE